MMNGIAKRTAKQTSSEKKSNKLNGKETRNYSIFDVYRASTQKKHPLNFSIFDLGQPN